MLTCKDGNNSAAFLPQLDLFLAYWNTANLFSLDRRKERRKAFPVRATIDLNGELRRGRGKNISTSGLSLSVEDPPPLSINQTIHLYMVNDSFYFPLEGKVRGIREMEQQPAENPSTLIVNLAIEFIIVPEKEKQVLDSLIKGYQERAVSFFLEASFSVQEPLTTKGLTNFPQHISSSDLSKNDFLLNNNFSPAPVSNQLNLPIRIS